MIPTVEGRHAWTPPGAGAVAVTLNYLKNDAGVTVYPRVKLGAGTILRNLGDVNPVSDPRVGGVGEIPRRTFRRGRPMTYAGFVEALSLAEYAAFAETLSNAFADVSAEGRMDMTWHPLLGGGPWPDTYCEAQSLGCEIGDPILSRDLFRGTFVLALRNHDGRYFRAGASVAAAVADTNVEYTFV